MSAPPVVTTDDGDSGDPDDAFAALPCTCDDSGTLCRPCSRRLVISMRKVNEEVDRMMERFGIRVKERL